MVKKIVNPFEDPAFNREEYERNRELIASGVNPYCLEEYNNFEEMENLELIRGEGIDDDYSGLENTITSGRSINQNKKNNGLRYLKFLEDNRRMEISENNFRRHFKAMKGLLKEYFSRFREGGKQDLEARDYDAVDVWKIYQAISDYARKVQKKFRGY